MPVTRDPILARYGTWASPVTARTVAAASLRLGGVIVDGDDIYWLEGRPEESGRGVVVKWSPGGHVVDVTPAPINVRTRVHEYGGAAYAVSQGVVYYSEFVDQRLYRLTPGGRPVALTPEGNWHYADCAIDPLRRRLVGVREDHSARGREAVTTLVSLPLDGPPRAGDVLVAGHDFYSTPRFSPDGTRLSWLAWRHPQMPWDGTELWVADLARDGTIERSARVAGSETESISQPGWSPDARLYFVSDRTGWWNLYCWHDERVNPVHPVQADFGRPLWQLSASTWAVADEHRLVVTYADRGRWKLATIEPSTGALRPVATDIEPADSLAASRSHAVLVAGSPSIPDAVVRVDLASGAVDTVRSASSVQIDARFLATPEAIEFPTEGERTSHAFHYAPRNPDFIGPADERPPLIVVSHGGPTSATHARLNLEIQYWTSRGFAVVDVNYGGSTGYGRLYRQRLRGQWGIVDVADCVGAARWLVTRGQADADRLAIRGRSAGGYTTLAALVFQPDVFKAGASYYGVADLERLAMETHKFESRYLEGLIGPYPAKAALYRARSPIHFVDRLSCPLILFQGLEDQVVPPDQARVMADAVRAKGLPATLLLFDHEQHGFRQAGTIVRCLEAELAFYATTFGLSS
jgi:dipeptidyl aminopeptidase/acylaminoacyl peptidase